MNDDRCEWRGMWSWPGGSFWLGRASSANDEHQHAAMQLTIVVDGSVRIARAGQPGAGSGRSSTACGARAAIATGAWVRRCASSSR
jgi:hypothetical protein